MTVRVINQLGPRAAEAMKAAVPGVEVIEAGAEPPPHKGSGHFVGVSQARSVRVAKANARTRGFLIDASQRE